MAVTFEGEHHKNPSGFNNKIKWLLSKSNWNIDNLEKIIKQIHIITESFEERNS